MPSNGHPYLPSTQSVLPRGNALLVDEDEKDLDYFGPLLSHLDCGTALCKFPGGRELPGARTLRLRHRESGQPGI
jgi:hypothetical protein